VKIFWPGHLQILQLARELGHVQGNGAAARLCLLPDKVLLFSEYGLTGGYLRLAPRIPVHPDIVSLFTHGTGIFICRGKNEKLTELLILQ
jgi:hypothetical protein